MCILLYIKYFRGAAKVMMVPQVSKLKSNKIGIIV